MSYQRLLKNAFSRLRFNNIRWALLVSAIPY
jgi:hypothetical protein